MRLVHFFNERVKRSERLFAFLLIFVFVTAFNYEAVFGLKTLIQDDFARYYDAINGNLFRHGPFSFVGAALKGFNKHLMLIDISFARLTHVIIFLIPLSFSVYILIRKHFGFSFELAIFSSIIICILPYQIHVPMFLDGNYAIVGLLFYFTSLLFALDYLKVPSNWNLLIAILFWYLSNYHFTIAELNLFLFPAVIILILFYSHGLQRHKLLLSILFVAIMSFSFFEVFEMAISGTSRSAATPVQLSLELITNRLSTIISWSSIIPRNSFSTPENHAFVTLIFYSLLIIAGISLILFRRRFYVQKKINFVVFFFFPIFSILATTPFAAFSPWVSPRHLFVAYVGFYIFLFYIIYIVATYSLRNFRYKSLAINSIFLLIVIYTGLNRHQNIKAHNDGLNRNYEELCKHIKGFDDIQPGSQIVVVNYHAGTGEHFIWSSGLYSYCLKKSDIVGILGREYSFYDPFVLSHRAYSYKMGGLDLESPIYASRFLNGQFYSPEYLLQWKERDRSDSQWTLFKLDKYSHKPDTIMIGNGIDHYSSALLMLGIKPSDVLWGLSDTNREWTKIELHNTNIEGKSMMFDRSYLEPVNHFGYNEWTFNVWIRPLVPIPGDAPFHSHYSILSGENNHDFLGLNNYAGLTNYTTLISRFSFNQTEWNYISYRYKDGELSAFVNGENAGSIKADNPLATVKRRRIAQRGDFTHHYVGHMMNVQLWDRALTQTEIQEAMFLKIQGTEPGLVGFWPLDSIFIEDGVKKTPDLSPSQNHGMLVGEPVLVKSSDMLFKNNE